MELSDFFFGLCILFLKKNNLTDCIFILLFFFEKELLLCPASLYFDLLGQN
jgi:hypothetical protein